MRIFAIALLATCLTSCTQRASPIATSQALTIADNLTYVRDSRTQLCFAVVASRHVVDWDQNGFTITWVPCTQEVVFRLGIASK
jgi:hypothetical protein